VTYRKEKVMNKADSDLLKELDALGPKAKRQQEEEEPKEPKEEEPKSATQEEPKEEESQKPAEESEEPEKEEEEKPDDAKTLEDIFQRMNDMFEVVAPSDGKEEGEKPTEKKEEKAADVSELFTDEDIENLDAKTLNKKISEFIAKDRQDTMRAMNAATSNLIQQQVQLNVGAMLFYQQNPELSKIKPYVTHKATVLMKKNPEWDYPTLFENLAKEVKKDIETFAGRKLEETSDERRPAFAKKPGASRRSGDARTPLQKELDELKPRR
jgi:hypothetical protein